MALNTRELAESLNLKSREEIANMNDIEFIGVESRDKFISSQAPAMLYCMAESNISDVVKVQVNGVVVEKDNSRQEITLLDINTQVGFTMKFSIR